MLIENEHNWPFLIKVDLEKDHFNREEATYLANTILEAVKKSEFYEHVNNELKNEP